MQPGGMMEFTFRFGQRVKVLSPHPEAGATGFVTNAYLFRNGREEVFVSVPGGCGRYEVDQLELAVERMAEPLMARSIEISAEIARRARPHLFQRMTEAVSGIRMRIKMAAVRTKAKSSA
jgi:hypothetical protein